MAEVLDEAVALAVGQEKKRLGGKRKTRLAV